MNRPSPFSSYLLRILGLFFSASIMLLCSWQLVRAEEECDTVFCGGGLQQGVDITKDSLQGTGIDTSTGLVGAILYWVRIILILAGIFAFVAFVWAGFLYITSFANDENQEKAKKVMIYAGMGIIVILISFALTRLFVTATVG